MSLSAFILDTLRVMDCEIFWFVQPIRVEVIAESLDNLQLDDERCWVNKIMRSEKHVCQHNNNCDSYILQVGAIHNICFNTNTQFQYCK